MSEDFVYSGSSSWIIGKNSLDQILSVLRDLNIFRERIIVHSNPFVSSFDVIRLKWRFANDQSVDDDTEGPDINLVRMSLLTFQDLWGDIIWSTTNGSFAFSVKLKLGG